MNPPKSPQQAFSRQVSDILRNVDGLLKKRDLDKAQSEISLAKSVEPKNMYVHAYHERIQLLLNERKRNNEAEAAHRKTEEEARIREEAERKKRVAEETKRKIDAGNTRRTVSDKKISPAEIPPPAPAKPVDLRPHSAELVEYNAALSQAWQNGIPGPGDSKALEQLRSSLNVTKEEHTSLEGSAKRESYIRAFSALWASKSVTDGPSTITALHKKHGITLEEFEQIDFELLKQIQAPKVRPQIVIVDDDESMLTAMGDLLQAKGFDTRPFTTSDDAYKFLLHSTPDLILADINLESSTMGGFAFFQKLQEIPRLAKLPFIFVSGLTDEIVIRTGKELGADDYITKPFASDTLVSIIKGKLRRYSELLSARTN